MFIVTVDAVVAAPDQSSVLSALQEAAETIRDLPGNQSFRPLIGDAPGRLTILQEWDTPEAFAGYQGHEIYGALNATLGPKLIEPPVIRKFSASLVE